MTDNTHIALTAPASVDMALITGPGDNLLRIVQSAFTARIGVRGDMITLEGDPTDVQSLTVLFSDLIKLVEDGGKPDAEQPAFRQHEEAGLRRLGRPVPQLHAGIRMAQLP